MPEFQVAPSSGPASWTRWMVGALALVQAILPAGWPGTFELQDCARFDFVVVGAGSGGSIVATRLSENPQWNVLLIEAGGDPSPLSVIPSTFLLLHHTASDWDYQPQLRPGVGEAHVNRTIYLSRGKGLGGSSSINYEIYARGVPGDYNEWNEVAPGWDWSSALYYFKKLEGMTDPSVLKNPRNSYLHSSDGPVLVSRPETNQYFDEAGETYLNSLQEIGVKRVLENNGPEIVGGARPHFTFANGRRSSTAEAYLKPAKDRPNLHVIKYARATKILIDPYNKEAYGVQVFLRTGQIVNVYANNEVVLSAGSIETPKLLMLSGIGPAEELEKHDIDVMVDLPVGKNLHDHQFTPMIFTGRAGLQSAVESLAKLNELDAYPLALQCAYFKLNNSRYCPDCASQPKPHIQIFNIRLGALDSLTIKYICKVVLSLEDSVCFSMVKSNLYREIDLTLVVLLHPSSRGRVTLRSRNPFEYPNIELGYYRNEKDVAMMTEGVKFMTRLVDTSYYRSVQGSVADLNVRACEYLEFNTDQYWRCYVKSTVSTIYHPVGTCPMGPGGVVDERLRVHGVSRLRIVDASIMPKIVSGNTNTPTMMVGEHGADLIKSDYLANNFYGNDVYL